MGVQQSNHIKFLKGDSGMELFLQVHIRQNHNLILCSYTKEGDPIQTIIDRELHYNGKKFKSEISKVINKKELIAKLKSPIETIKLNPIPPWHPPHKVFNLGTEKDKSKSRVIETLYSLTLKDIVIFPDGSDIPNKGKGEEVVIEKKNLAISKQIPLTAKVSSFEIELVGIILAIEAARRAIAIRSIKVKKTNSIYISSDNQGALLKSEYPFKPSTAQYL
ncbi:hypothetical protein O181_036887 [Austropuccinia psidii MF-1]|uniref:RNase H type-1 domain-containing protein n=1 Tax=Austropuccinia psidii MF-1 TaxID=1389203 RepID=A0A9Q3HAC7_9BASI|nr:hypothetical protein [Austropuccinia psidii MF-1]